MADLFEEFAMAVGGIAPTSLRDLRRLGASPEILWGGRSRIGRHPITRHGRFFELAEDGPPAWIIAEGIPEFGPYGWAEIEDLVAFYTEHPERMWLRTGQVDVIGQMAIWNARDSGNSLHLYRSPLGLLADSDGACLVDWQCDPRDVFAGISRVECEDKRLEDRLRARIAECSKPPITISTRRSSARRAA